MVKNTVIVPVGSKGGFFVKKPPVGGDRDAQVAEGIACYRMFIAGLLDITDNLVDGKVAPPHDVVRHDLDDPYLVVAADKGTATFSDIANCDLDRARLLARRRVRFRRFQRLRPQGHGHHRQGRVGVGKAPFPRARSRQPERRTSLASALATCPATCSATACCCRGTSSCWPRSTTGISSSTRTPMPNASFVERERMFQLPRSSWEDYDKSLISEGGGIFPRNAKSIPVSPQVRAVARDQGGCRAHDAERVAQRDTQGAGGSAVERRHRYLCEGHCGDRRRCRRPGQQRVARQWQGTALQGGGRGRQPGHDPEGPHRGRASRRAVEHRFHRQLRRRRHLRPRGEHQDPAERCGASAASSPRKRATSSWQR